jgi:hypothetical protein
VAVNVAHGQVAADSIGGEALHFSGFKHGNALPTTHRRAGSPLSLGQEVRVDRDGVGAGLAAEQHAIKRPDTDQAESEADSLSGIVVLRASDEVQGNVLLFIDG